MDGPRTRKPRAPGARLLSLPGRDHLNAVGDRRFREVALAFLAEAQRA
jgi:hypothetical protein